MMSQTIDVQQFIDQAPPSRLQRKVLWFCFATVLIDGFDVGVVGFLAPAIAKQWQLGPGGLTPLLIAGLIGLIAGALVFGPVSDRYGRRPALLITTTLFGAMCLASSFATSIEQLTLLRFATGIGLGAAMPNAAALSSEFAPSARRSSLITAMFCGFALGMAVAGLVAAAILPIWGWQGVLAIGGILPLLLAIAIWRYLPESPRLMALQGGQDDALRTILAQIAPVDPDTRFTITESKTAAPVRQLFSTGLGSGTLLIWLISFMGLLIVYLIGNWLPTLLSRSGFTHSQSALLTTAFHIGGASGAFAVGRFMDRYRHSRVLAIAYAGGMISILIAGMGGGSGTVVALGILGTGVFVSAAQVGLNALAAHHYPTSARATGISWMHGIGRVGSVLGIAVGGALMTLGWQFGELFSLLAIPTVFAATAVLVYGMVYLRR